MYMKFLDVFPTSVFKIIHQLSHPTATSTLTLLNSRSQQNVADTLPLQIMCTPQDPTSTSKPIDNTDNIT